MKKTVTEMENTLDGIKSTLHEAENQISHLEDEVAENTESKQQKNKIKLYKASIV